jgi:hypothetical protein
MVLFEVENRGASEPYQRLPKSIFGKVTIAESADIAGITCGSNRHSLIPREIRKEVEWSGATLPKSLILLNDAISYVAACGAA